MKAELIFYVSFEKKVLLKLCNQLLNPSDSEEGGLKCKAAQLLVREVALNSEVYQH